MATTNDTVTTTYTKVIDAGYDVTVDIQPLDDSIEVVHVDNEGTPLETLNGFQLAQLGVHNIDVRKSEALWIKSETDGNRLVLGMK